MASTTEGRTLVVNADDFGLSEGINRGIIEAFVAGGLTSTSIMVGMPAFQDAVRRARSAASLGVGLHFTLTSGCPLTRAPSLIDPDSGEFLGLRALLTRALRHRVRRREVEDECAAQIARAREAGLHLTHLDGHHHVHLLPGIAPAVRRVVQAERIPVVRRPSERLVGFPGWTRRLPERVLIALLARTAHPARSGAATTDHFIGSALLGARDFHGALLRALDALRGGTTELMVHPGYVTAALPGADTYTTQREEELRALTAADVLERLHSGRIRLAHFGQIAHAA